MSEATEKAAELHELVGLLADDERARVAAIEVTLIELHAQREYLDTHCTHDGADATCDAGQAKEAFTVAERVLVGLLVTVVSNAAIGNQRIMVALAGFDPVVANYAANAGNVTGQRP